MNSQSGTALVATVLLLMVVSALCAALTISASTETLIARNHQAIVEARAAADAGLSHAVDLTIAHLRNWRDNGFLSPGAAMSAMLAGPDALSGTPADDADNGSLESFGIPRPPGRVALGTRTGIGYDARLFDDDDAARGTPLNASDIERIGEDGNPAADANLRLVIQARGYAARSAVSILEVMVVPLVLPALVTNEPLLISGNARFDGSGGSVHSNGNLTITGSPAVEKNATASGGYIAVGMPQIGGMSGGDYPAIGIPAVRAIDHIAKADFILTATGTVTTPTGTVLCDAEGQPDACAAAGYGWVYAGMNGWVLSGSGSPAAGTYYIEGAARISTSPGSSAPIQLSIIAEGDIEITGDPYIIRAASDLLFVTNGDLRIAGGLTVPAAFESQILVREQLHIEGNATIAGQILVAGAASVSSLVTENTIAESPTLTYSGSAGLGDFAVSGWRIVR